jgi:hypothetical protein
LITLNSISPSYGTISNQRRFDSFDLGSADEIGMLAHGIRPVEILDVNVSSNKILPLTTTSTLSNLASGSNTTNGLFACDHYLNMYN